jgi:hypothetical protein
MPYIEEAYSPDKMDNLLQYLTSSKEQGEPEDFEIFVDAFKVVKRTNDINRFDCYSSFIQPQTQSISVLIFDGSSNRNTKHKFNLKEDKQGLSGVDVDSRIHEKIKSEREKWDNELLKKEYDILKSELKDAEDTIDQLEAQLELTKDTKPRLNEMGLVEVASVVLEGFVRRNPQMLTKLPGGEALAGVFIQDNEEKQKMLDAPKEIEPKVSFTIEDDNDTEKGTPIDTLSEKDKASLGFVKQLNEAFTREQMEKVMLILDALSKTPTNIESTIQFLSEQKK